MNRKGRRTPYRRGQPLGKHLDSCASFCANYNGKDNSGPCETKHDCWCEGGKLSYAEYQKAHPDAQPAI